MVYANLLFTNFCKDLGQYDNYEIDQIELNELVVLSHKETLVPEKIYYTALVNILNIITKGDDYLDVKLLEDAASNVFSNHKSLDQFPLNDLDTGADLSRIRIWVHDTWDDSLMITHTFIAPAGEFMNLFDIIVADINDDGDDDLIITTTKFKTGTTWLVRRRAYDLVSGDLIDTTKRNVQLQTVPWECCAGF